MDSKNFDEFKKRANAFAEKIGAPPLEIDKRVEAKQRDRLLAYLKKEGSVINPIMSWRQLGITGQNLCERIAELVEGGHPIESTEIVVTNTFNEAVRVPAFWMGRR